MDNIEVGYKTIYRRLSWKELKAAKVDRAHFEALCLSMFIKSEFDNSLIYKRKARELKLYFRIGYEKLKRVLEDAIRFGYAEERKDGSIFFRSLKASPEDKEDFDIILSFKRAIKRGERATQTIKSVEREINMKMLGAHIEHVNSIENIKKMLREPNSTKEYKSAIRKSKKTYVDSRKTTLYEKHVSSHEEYNALKSGVSKRNLSRVIGKATQTTHLLIKQMKKDGVITNIHHNVQLTNMPNSQLHYLKKYAPEKLNELEHQGQGFARTCKTTGSLIIQFSNSYQLSHQICRKPCK